MERRPLPQATTTPWGSILSLVVGLLYGVSPIDLLPDLIPLIGWLDDAAIVPLMLVIAVVLWRRQRRVKSPKFAQDSP